LKIQTKRAKWEPLPAIAPGQLFPSRDTAASFRKPMTKYKNRRWRRAATDHLPQTPFSRSTTDERIPLIFSKPDCHEA
jgi:hypothetical protein